MAEVKGDLPSKKENSIVPFPKELIFSGEGTLELYFRTLPEGIDFVSYDKLPDEFTSVGIEHYLNWLARLTNEDPKHRERGSWLHLGQGDRIIYPSNPTIGREREVVNAIFTKNFDKFFPFARSHSHSDGSCFSPQDLKRALSMDLFIAEALGTQKRNFLLLRSDQSTFDDPNEIDDKLNGITRDIRRETHRVDTILEASVASGELPREAVDHFSSLLLLAELAEFGTKFPTYYLTVAAALFASDEYKLGFYVSDKAGIYRRVKMADLDQILQKERELNRKIFDNLGQRT